MAILHRPTPEERGPALSAPYFLRYPLYVTCANPSALEGSNYPLFLLSETGAPPSIATNYPDLGLPHA